MNSFGIGCCASLRGAAAVSVSNGQSNRWRKSQLSFGGRKPFNDTKKPIHTYVLPTPHRLFLWSLYFSFQNFPFTFKLNVCSFSSWRWTQTVHFHFHLYTEILISASAHMKQKLRVSAHANVRLISLRFSPSIVIAIASIFARPEKTCWSGETGM